MRNTMIKKLLLNQGKYETVQGVPPLTLEKSLGKDLRDYKLYGNSFQDGIPTPDAPIEVESVGEFDETTGKYKIPIVVQGKNLFDISSSKGLQSQYAGVTSYVDGDSIITSTTTNRTVYLCLGTLKPNIYTFSYESFKTVANNDAKFSGVYVGSTISGLTSISYTTANNTNFTFTLNTEQKVWIRHGGITATGSPYTLTGVQVEIGDTATNYEPYVEPIETNIYLDEPLRKAGTVADCIDFENGVVVRNIKRTELTKADSTYTWNNTKGVLFYGRLDGNYYINKNAVSNRVNQFDQDWPATTSMWIGVTNAVVFWIRILDYLGFTTLDEFNAWLAENPTYVYYATNTPTETTIELPKLPTLKGTTVLDTKTNLALSNMSVVYKRK